MNLTEWYPGNVKPVRIGIYARQIPWMGIHYSFWNGEFWGGFAGTCEIALSNQETRSFYQLASWRGVSKPQERK